MLTENRKRQRSGGEEQNGQLVPQAKRQSRGHPLSPEPGRDAFDSESSNSESSISTPDHTSGNCTSHCVMGPCSPVGSGNPSELAAPVNMASYLHINRILKHAHFQSLQNRGRLRDTWSPGVILSGLRREEHVAWEMSHAGPLHSALPTCLQLLQCLWTESSSWSGIWTGVHPSDKSKW